MKETIAIAIYFRTNSRLWNQLMLIYSLYMEFSSATASSYIVIAVLVGNANIKV